MTSTGDPRGCKLEHAEYEFSRARMTAVRSISACWAVGMEMAGDWEKVQDVKVGEGPNHMGWPGPQALFPLRLLPPQPAS